MPMATASTGTRPWACLRFIKRGSIEWAQAQAAGSIEWRRPHMARKVPSISRWAAHMSVICSTKALPSAGTTLCPRPRGQRRSTTDGTQPTSQGRCRNRVSRVTSRLRRGPAPNWSAKTPSPSLSLSLAAQVPRRTSRRTVKRSRARARAGSPACMRTTRLCNRWPYRNVSNVSGVQALRKQMAQEEHQPRHRHPSRPCL